MAVTWWRNALIRSRKSSAFAVRARRHPVVLHVECFEDRVVPSANTYKWTGASGTNTNWNNPANWAPVGAATGAYPGDGADGAADRAQFVDLLTPSVNPKVNGAFSIGEIDFGSASNVTLAGDGVAGHSLTLAGSAKIVSADTFGLPTANTGLDEVAVSITVPTSLEVVNSAAAATALVLLDTVTLGSGASMTTDGSNNVQLGTLQSTGSNTLAVNTPTALVTNLASIAATDTLAIQGSSTLRIAGASTFGGTVILSGGTVSVGNNLSLGTGGLALSSGSVQASAAGLTLNNPLALLGGGSVALGDPINGITLGGAYSLPASFSIHDNGRLTLSGLGSLSGAATLTVSGSSPLVLSGGLALSGNSNLMLPGADAITVSGSVHLGSSTLTLTPSALLTLSGNVNGSGGLTVTGTGTGTTILSGPNSYTGATSVLGVTLQLGDGIVPLASLTTSAIIDNGTLLLDNPSGQTLSYGGPISGTGGLTQLGVWTLTLTGNNSYTGPTSIAPGATVQATSTTAFGNSDVTLPSSSTLNVETPGGATANLGSGLVGTYYSTLGATTYPPPSFNSQTTLLAFAATLGAPLATDTSAIDNGQNNGGAVFDYGQNGAGFPSAVRNVNPSGGNPTQFMGLWQGVFFAPVAGTYTFDTGSDDGSMLFLDGTPVVKNNYNQFLTVRSGAIDLPVGAHNLVIAYYQRSDSYGFFADVQGPGLPQERIPNALLGTLAPTLLQMGSLSGSGTVNLAQSAALPNNGILVGTDNNSTTFNGTINAIGTTVPNFPNLVKAGSGTFILPDGESYLGSTGISGGTLQLGSATSSLNSLPTSNIVDNGNLTVYLPGTSTLSYGGAISGTGGLTLQNTGGTLTLSGANTYSGPTVVGANTITQMAPNALPPLSVFTLGSGSGIGTVDLNGFSGGLGGIIAAGTGTGNAVTNSAGTAATLTLTGVGSLINDNVPITGLLSLVVTGSGSEVISAANSYTGSTTIAGSTLIVANDAAVPANSALVVSRSGVLDLNGHSLSVASLGGFGLTNTITDSSTTPARLTLTGSTGGYYTGAITGPVSLNDAGAAPAVTTLGGGPSNTFSGGVTATSGILVGVAGSFGSGPAVLNGGTLELASSGAAVDFGYNGTGWTLNNVGGGALFQAPNVLQLTSAAGPEATSFFYNTPVQPNAGFTSSFLYQDQSPGNSNPGNGLTFTLQADPQGPFALGGADGSLGYGPGGSATNPDGSIKNSLAIAWNLSSGAAGGLGTALDGNGAINATVNPSGGFNMLTSGDPIQVVISYNAGAQILAENLTDTVSGATTFENFYGINLFSYFGSSNAFIGFTGATGAANAMQVVSNFSYLSIGGGSASFTNDLQAAPGTTLNLPLVVNRLSNSFTTSGNLTVASGVTVNVTAVPASNVPYSLTVGGSTTLGGTLNLANNGSGTATLNLNGSVSGVGSTIGNIGGNGNVNLGPNSTYNVVLGGTGAGQYTDLGIGGALSLSGGNLTVSFAPGFSPGLGQSFTIANSAGPLSGTFSQGSTITVNGVTFAITYNRTVLRSIVITPTSVVTPTKVVITAPSGATAGAPVTLTIAAEDDSGNLAGDFNRVVTLSSTDGTIEPTSVTLRGGSATVQVTLTTAGVQTITASFPGLASGTASITIVSDGFAEFLVSDPVVVAGSNFLVQVQAADQFGNPVTRYTGPASVTATITPATPAGDFPLFVSMGSTGFGFALGQINLAGTYQITATSGSYPCTAAAITVVPGPPVSLAFAAQPVNTPSGVTLPTVTVQILDALGNVVTGDNLDTVTVAVADGPGSFTAGSTTFAIAQNGVASFSNLSFTTPGTYMLSPSVASLYAGPTSAPFTIANLQVLAGSFASSPSGFSLTFNAPILINSTTPVLYGAGFGATGVVPSVTLLQTADGSGNPLITPVVVEGSVVLHPATNSLTFVETNTASVSANGTPLLPDGTYVARLTSTAATNGFQGLYGGGYLDGTYSGTPGNDFTATFTVGAAAANDDVVWVPATADGPKQALNAPGNNQIGGGYPVYLNDSTGAVTSVNVTLNYDPTMLTVTGATSNHALPGSSFILNKGASTPGHAVLAYSDSGANSANLMGGGIPLGFLQATVPNSSAAVPIYKGKDLLTLAGISVNGGSIPAVGNDALHLVAYVGDADGQGSYNAVDAVLITRVSLQTDTGFVAYPLVDPVIAADTDGDGFIPADAALQANEAGVGFPAPNLSIPPVPAGADSTPISNSVDPSLTLPGNLKVEPDGTVTVPVNIDDAHPVGSTGLMRAHLALTYNPRLFTVSAADVHPGSVLADGNWNIVPSIDPATGQIGIALASTTPIGAGIGGSLVTIAFHQIGSGAGSATFQLVPSVRSNGQLFATEVEDAQGTFTLTPAPTSRFDPRIDAVVTLIAAPAAGGSAPRGAGEAVPIESTAPAVREAGGAAAFPATHSPSATGIPDSIEQEPLAMPNTTAEPVLDYGTLFAAHTIAMPITALVFQFANTPLVNAQGAVGFSLGQPLADTFFQLLNRGADPYELRLLDTVHAPFERFLAGQRMRAPFAADGLNGDELDDLELQGARGSGARLRRQGLPAAAISLSPAGDQAILDRVFAETAEASDLLPEEQ